VHESVESHDRAALPGAAPSVARAVGQFVLAGFAAVAIFFVGSLFIVRELGQSEAIRDARQTAVLAGQGIVEPVLTDALLRRDPDAIAAVDRIVQERVLGDRIVRVKIWTRSGRIVYSDEPRLIGDVQPLGKDKLDVLASGEAHSELSDLAGPENRFERAYGELYEVYLRVRAPDGTPLLFETYQQRTSVAASGRRIWLPFAGLLFLSLVLLWLVQVPLAWRLARRLRRSQLDRERLLVRAVEASADERARIAADLHEGVVQDLAGISYSLSAAADRAGPSVSPDLSSAMHEAAVGTRDSMWRLRSLLVDIHPPNLRASGLDAALTDLLSPLKGQGVETSLSVTENGTLADEVEQLIYSAAGEALRNVRKHAWARSVSVTVDRADGRARLEVVDDGRGFTAEERRRSRAEGHVGLSLFEELAERMNGRLDVESSPGRGTRFVLEVPST
jgi:two-component system, NarL family, sensor kinase